MPPSEGQEPRALTVAAQAIEGRKCAETAKVHPDLRIVYNLAYGVLADEAGRFSLVGDYTTIVQSPTTSWLGFFLPVSTNADTTCSVGASTAKQPTANATDWINRRQASRSARPGSRSVHEPKAAARGEMETRHG